MVEIIGRKTALIIILFSINWTAAVANEGGLRVLFMGLVDQNLNPLSDWLSQEPGTVYSIVPSRLYKGSWGETHGDAFQEDLVAASKLDGGSVITRIETP